jgi:Putative prokaryotic signal transducing protein
MTVEVGVYRTRSEAEIAQGALAAAGIESFVSADDAGGMIPFDLSGGVRLLVEDADAEEAASILTGGP